MHSLEYLLVHTFFFLDCGFVLQQGISILCRMQQRLFYQFLLIDLREPFLLLDLILTMNFAKRFFCRAQSLSFLESCPLQRRKSCSGFTLFFRLPFCGLQTPVYLKRLLLLLREVMKDVLNITFSLFMCYSSTVRTLLVCTLKNLRLGIELSALIVHRFAPSLLCFNKFVLQSMVWLL